jgi:hypothetical protein
VVGLVTGGIAVPWVDVILIALVLVVIYLQVKK